MDRIIDPLSSVGAKIKSKDNFIPIEINSSKKFNSNQSGIKIAKRSNKICINTLCHKRKG